MEREWRLDIYKDTITWVGGIYQPPDKDVGWSFIQAFLSSSSVLCESARVNTGRIGPSSTQQPGADIHKVHNWRTLLHFLLDYESGPVAAAWLS
jgi:hypothetical protein